MVLLTFVCVAKKSHPDVMHKTANSVFANKLHWGARTMVVLHVDYKQNIKGQIHRPTYCIVIKNAFTMIPPDAGPHAVHLNLICTVGVDLSQNAAMSQADFPSVTSQPYNTRCGRHASKFLVDK